MASKSPKQTAGRDNNFDLLRLIGAILVLVSHSFGILNKGLQQPGIWVKGNFIIPSEIGLCIFFTISGYLVTQSMVQSKTWLHYLWKRFLRIVPALVVVNFACIIMGGIIGELPLREYLRMDETWGYLLKNSSLIVNQFSLPGVFKTLDDQSVNASLWTILVEVKFYLLLMLAGITGLLNRKWLLLCLFLLFQGLRIFLTYHKVSVEGISLQAYFNFGTYFSLGTLAFCFRQQVSFHWLIAIGLLILAILSQNTLIQPITLSMFFAYLVLLTGSGSKLISLKGHDFSYGLYLYAFPVQQVVLLFAGYGIPVWLHIFLSTIIAVLFGMASWFAIEKPALKKKALLD